MLFDIYIYILSFIFVLLFYALYLIKFSPSKIKIIGNAATLILLIRYICVLIMLLASNIMYLYLLKVPYFLNFLGIPLIVSIMFYVFLRRNRINFDYIFLISLIAVVIYVFIIYKFPVVISGINGFGYTMYFKENTLIYWVYIAFNTIVLFLSIIFSQKPNVNRVGFYMLVLSSFVSIVENIEFIVNIRFLPENIFGDLLFIITFVYALIKLRK